MARNLREGSLGQVNVRNDSGADIYGGYVATAGGVTGVAVTDAAAGEVVALDRRPYVHYLFGKTATTPPHLPHQHADELAPPVPGYAALAGAAAGTVVAVGGLSVQIVEQGPGDVYNTPADHVLVSIVPQPVAGLVP